MLNRILKILSGIVATITTLIAIKQIFPEGIFSYSKAIYIVIICMLIASFFVFYLITGLIIRQAPKMADKIESYIKSRLSSMYELVLGFIGALCGMIIATLLSVHISHIPIIGIPASIILTLLFGYIGYVVLLRYKNDKIFTKIREKYEMDYNSNYVGKLLDTSVIIDGRILDILRCGFMDGQIIVADFVIEELKTLSDSADDLKRNRGRRGLDILANMQSEFDSKVKVMDLEKEVLHSNGVDDKLIYIAKKYTLPIVTNDFNLNKVAKIQSVDVLNINELSNALKPQAQVGDDIRVTIVKGGKEREQGIAYLDSGTMVVVENTKDLVGETVIATVTSVIQTNAGRMIFADLNKSS